MKEARSLLGAKRGLEHHPSHHGEMRGGRSRTQDERLESPWAWASACIYNPPGPVTNTETSTCFWKLCE